MSSPNLGQNADEVFANMSALAAADRAAGSRRAIFVQLYVMVTGAVRERASRNFFEDSQWALRYLVAFANLYGKARFDFANRLSGQSAARVSYGGSI